MSKPKHKLFLLEKVWNIWIDTGGTFTDCISKSPEGSIQKLKVLSSGKLKGMVRKNNRENLLVDISWPINANIFESYKLEIDGSDQAFNIEKTSLKNGIIQIDADPGVVERRKFEIFSGEEAPIVAARLATATPLHSKLPHIEMRLGSTKGTNALLERKGADVTLLTTKGHKDLLAIGSQQRPNIFSLNVEQPVQYYCNVVEIEERMGADGTEIISLDNEYVSHLAENLKSADINTVSVALMNSYTNNKHEQLLYNKLKQAGIKYVSISSEMTDEIGLLSRAQTVVANAYLSEIIENYLKEVKNKLSSGNLKVMTSAGGLVESTSYLPKDSLLSGPAGGVVGCARIASKLGFDMVLSFDMGGTSTDVSRYSGRFDYKYYAEIGDLSIKSPTLSIETVAAGGGSICGFDGYKFFVGPQSAGAYPGPACYGNNGPLSITDINLLLGRIDASNFSMPLNKEASQKAFQHQYEKTRINLPQEEVLISFLKIANEKMAEAIRKISISKGYDPSEHALLAFGGAGGQHACDIARLLDTNTVIVPFDAGLLSAYGIGNAAIERFASMQILKPFSEVEKQLSDLFNKLEQDAVLELTQEGCKEDNIYVRQRLVYLRFSGQEDSIEIDFDKGNLKSGFRAVYEKLYGHWIDTGEIEVESVKLIAADSIEKKNLQTNMHKKYRPEAHKFIRTFIGAEWEKVAGYNWEALEQGAEIIGPALLMSKNSTVFVDADWKAELRSGKDAILSISASTDKTEAAKKENGDLEFAELELFANRFKSVADNMGAILQRTAFSVNVKDRLDFSCAVLNSKGYLVANAPHIPVHLGSLGVCTRKVLEVIDFDDGDIIITNHPGFGGSHLPDVTLIAPVFYKNAIVGFVTNRAHHAEIGGKTPGSMPADASNLAEEGVVIKPTYLMKSSKVQWQNVKELFENAAYPSRAVEENMADLNGALASINKGIDELTELCAMHGKSKVQLYMDKLLNYSGASIFNTFKKIENDSWDADEYLDDGSLIRVNISKSHKEIVFDFNGTSPTHQGNLNANLAILNSAVVYVLRLMMEEPLPLNEGLMKFVKIKAPESLLNPSFHDDPERSPAVVGGNTETSQRIVDTLIKALRLAACSQGTMNNLIFGNTEFGFYETIGGGVGAGDGFAGASAVHQHMTNTKITDPEILEHRYPVVLEKMAIRENSGGDGQWKGGDGIVREIRFKEDVILTILSQHRTELPYGMNGGKPGKAGRQVLERADGSIIELKGIETIEVKAGDRVRIETPGGGGFGKALN